MHKDTKQTIIDMSYKLFQQNGYDATTVNDICDACNITKTTFYRYLDSKEDILTYFFNNIDYEVNDILIKMATTNDYWEQIKFIFDLIANRVEEFGKELYTQLYITNLKDYRGTFDEVTGLKQLVSILIRKGQEAGQIQNPSNPEELYELCDTIFFGCCIRWCLGLTELSIHDYYTETMALALQIK